MSVRIVNGQLTILDDERLVIAAPGNIIPLLPTAHDLQISNMVLDYPDPPADYAYLHNWSSAWASYEGVYGLANSCSVGFTRLPQEWSAPQVIGTAPVGATFPVVMARLQRTIGPSHTWNTQTLIARPPDNEEVPFAGSLLLESVIGISRLLHITLDPVTRQVILEQEQSVVAGSGGYGNFGASTPGYQSNRSGGSLKYGSAPGTLVYAASGYRYSRSSGVTTYTGVIPEIKTTNHLGNHQVNGAEPGSLSDPTNYAVRYIFNARIMFGKD